MTREKKIAAIYKEIADKELTFGCKITTNEYNGDEFKISTADSLAVKEGESYRTIGCECCSEDLTIKEIIGHPIMIGDVLIYFEKKDRIMTSTGEFEGTVEDPTCIKEEYHIRDKIAKLLYLYTNKIEPIEKQSNECINYIYSLIQKD